MHRDTLRLTTALRILHAPISQKSLRPPSPRAVGGEAAGGVEAAAEGAAAFVVVGLEEELELLLSAGAGFVLLGVEGDEEGEAFAELGGEVLAGGEEGEDAEGALALGGGFIALAGAGQGIGVAVADDNVLQNEVGVGGVICDKFTCYPRGFC